MPKEKTILSLIQEIETSDDPRPVVLPLMCGAGKSQSIAAKIKDAIIKGEGLLIVTDRTSRFNDYLNPIDPEVKSFIEAHQDQITVMKSSEIDKAYQTYGYTPILLMTSQRYFSLDKEEIKKLLEYKQYKETKNRHLIIFDEKPDLYFQYDVGIRNINQFENAYFLGINSFRDQKKKNGFLQFWIQEKAAWYYALLSHENLFHDDKKQYMLFMIQQSYGDEISSFNYDDLSEEEKELAQEIMNTDFWNITLPQQFQHFIRSKRRSMYEASQCDPVKFIRAFLLRNKFPLYSFRNAETGSYASYFTVIENDKEKLTDIGAKVIILDGTADLSPEYCQDYLHVDSDSCKPYIRKIPSLHIKLIKYNLSRKRSKQLSREEYKSLEQFIQNDSGKEKVCIFTYMNILQAFETDFDGDDEIIRRDHLGNLKGRNDFQEYDVFAQIGLLRKPPSFYASMMIERNPELQNQLSSKFAYDPLECARILDELTKSDQYRKIVYRDLLADIEQNVFRSPVRSPDYEKDVLYYLFFDYEKESMLRDMIINRFQEKYGATVSMLDPSSYFAKEKIKSRKSASGQTHAQKIIAYIESLENGTVIAKNKIHQHVGLTKEQYEKTIEKTPYLKEYIKKCSPSPRSRTFTKQPFSYQS